MTSWRCLALAASILLVSTVEAQDELGPEPVAGDTDFAVAEPVPSTPQRPTRSLEPERDLARVIELRTAIEEAMRRNPFEQVRINTNAQIDLLKSDLFETFWMPNLTLDLNTSNQRYDRIYKSQSQPQGLGSQVSPNGTFGITIQDYNVFNWGRDYLAYLNDKNTLKREEQKLTEARRRLRFSVIAQYFALVRAKEFVQIYREQLRQASFIHRLAREKLQLRKIPAMEYYQTRGEFLRAQTEYQQSLFDVAHEEEKLSNLLGDEYRPAYKIVEQLKFTTLGTTNDEAIKQAMDTSPAFRDAKLAYENASRSYEKTLKDNLPLPKFTMGLGSYQQQFAPNGNNWLHQTNTGRNVELVAAVNMSWTLLGEGGLFNSRENKRSYLEKRISEIRFYNIKRELEVRIRTLLRTVRFLEQKVTIAEFQDKNARSNYDSTLDNYTAGRTTFPQIKLALDNRVLSDINTENVKYDHLLKKLELADVMGLDDLPGENFETLAVR
ncbi:MAG: TolC family protein [Bacteriovoracia bacterium]